MPGILSVFICSQQNWLKISTTMVFLMLASVAMRLHKIVAQLGRYNRREWNKTATIDRAEHLVREFAGEAIEFVGIAQQTLGLFHNLTTRGSQAHTLRMMADEQL